MINQFCAQSLEDIQATLSLSLNTESDSEGTHSPRVASVSFLKVALSGGPPRAATAEQREQIVTER